MADYQFEETEFGILGTMPSGEQFMFHSEEEYSKAYWAEVDEIVDEMARLEEENRTVEVDFDDLEWLKWA